MSAVAGEIVGLNYGTNGRSCCSHPVCGVSLMPGDLIRFKPCVVTRKFKDGSSVVENALKAVKVVDGCETCHVGFIATATVVSSRLVPASKTSLLKFWSCSKTVTTLIFVERI
jgi:hypothetical protein